MLEEIIKLCECGIKCPELHQDIIRKIQSLMNVDWSVVRCEYDKNKLGGIRSFQNYTDRDFPIGISKKIVEEVFNVN